MDTLETLKKNIEEYTRNASWDDHIFDIIPLLLSSDSDEMLRYHYGLYKDESIPIEFRQMILRFFAWTVENKRDPAKSGDFLTEQFRAEEDTGLKAEILTLLGNINYPPAKELVMENILSAEYNVRYASIIVLGWIGNGRDFATLNERMVNDPDGVLRGYAATAMRQIWFRRPRTRDTIGKYIYNAAPGEKDEDAKVSMIITVQDLYKKKFGIREGKYGDISGEVNPAWNKMNAFLEKTFKQS